MDISVIEQNKNFIHMLEFETEIFLNIHQKDGLVIAAKGLSMDVVIMNLIKTYCDPGNLVIVLNASDFEKKYFKQRINDDNIHDVPCTVNMTEREDLYLSGGVHLVTTRMLVIDMLKNRIPIDKITGFIVLRAHTILESCQQAFVLRLYRQQNKTGFIKAFSSSPQAFTVGFHQVERIMRTLFVKELYLWPRFHHSIIQCLKQREPQVIELHIPISENMSKLQTCLLDLMNLTVKELKQLNRTLEIQEITVENCLTKNFHKILQNQLNCTWHQLNSKSKQLVAELKTLRHLVITMLYTDSVSFYKYLLEYRKIEYAQIASWVLLEPAEILFSTGISMVYNKNKELNPEFCPKWKALSEILKAEIPSHIKTLKLANAKVLILCQDVKTCYQLNQYLTNGPYHYLFLMALKHGINIKSISEEFSKCESLRESYTQKAQHQSTSQNKATAKKLKNDNSEPSEKAKEQIDEEDEDADFKDTYILTMSQTFCQGDESLHESSNVVEDEVIFEPCKEIENLDLTQLILGKPTVLIQTFKSANFLSLQKTLEDIRPNYIIMYHNNMTAIRQIELYEARRTKDHPLMVYFLIHSGTVEEQSYLTTLRREKEAFEFLIETKSTMVVPEDQDGKSDECAALQRDIQTETVSTRQGGRQIQGSARKSVIVDMREFRSELPALIHKRGIDVNPVTITVGDYILTPEICVERKSLSDLIGSLNSGRLYQQCTQMSRYYSKPMLLIEFDQNRPFNWRSNYMISGDENNFEVQQKLLLLTLHFPKLKIVWSASPYASAQLFEELKEGKEEPNAQHATAIGAEHDMHNIETKYNAGVFDFVQKLPGITSKNIDSFLRNVKSMDGAVKKSEEELKEVLGNARDAGALYSILHEEHAPKENVELKKTKSKTKFKYAGKAKKN